MKHIFLLFFLFLSSHAFANDMILPFRGVVDGDTVNTTLKLPCPLCNASVRQLGIDTPESNHLAKCAKERELGLKAKAFTASLFVNQEEFMARRIRWDKYGGRILGYIEVNGVDLGKALIDKGLAKPYFGSGPKPDWCD
jgi:micrococcal nuclease